MVGRLHGATIERSPASLNLLPLRRSVMRFRTRRSIMTRPAGLTGLELPETMPPREPRQVAGPSSGPAGPRRSSSSTRASISMRTAPQRCGRTPTTSGQPFREMCGCAQAMPPRRTWNLEQPAVGARPNRRCSLGKAGAISSEHSETRLLTFCQRFMGGSRRWASRTSRCSRGSSARAPARS